MSVDAALAARCSMLAGTSNCGHCIMLTRCIDSVFLPQLGEHRVGHPLVMIMVCVCVCVCVSYHYGKK